MQSIDGIIIGGGVIGLATGSLLSRQFECCVLEQEAIPGSHTSSRNSGVIHAGLYYPPDFLKTRLCIAGRERLYHYCQQHAIEHRRCGKLLVATDKSQLARLQQLQKQAAGNGLALQWLDKVELNALEPALSAYAALLSPHSGIIDSDQLMRQLCADIEQNGSYIACRQQVSALEKTANGFTVTINHSESIHCRWLINSAGLQAQAIAAMLLPDALIPPLYYSKGQYYSYQHVAPFSHLIYPVPPVDGSGLGIHATLDISGQIRFGPDATPVNTPDYVINDDNRATFIKAIRSYYPALDENRLQADYCGIRPRLNPPGTATADFCIQTPDVHGLQGLINLYGVESPGLTASLAIANTIAQQVAG